MELTEIINGVVRIAINEYKLYIFKIIDVRAVYKFNGGVSVLFYGESQLDISHDNKEDIDNIIEFLWLEL